MIVEENKQKELTFKKKTYQIMKKLHVFAVGKCAVNDMNAVLEILNASNIPIGTLLAYTKKKELSNTNYEVLLGDHPYLTHENIENSKYFVQKLQDIEQQDDLLFLLSGGTSALLEIPIKTISSEDLISEHENLLRSGKSITEINQRRMQLSSIKNGGLRKFIATDWIFQLVHCDIPIEDPYLVGSSPLLKKGDSFCENRIFQSAQQLFSKLQEKYAHWIFGEIYDCDLETMIDDIEQKMPKQGSFVFVSGGEAPVILPQNHGKGGRNTHFCLAMAEKLYKTEIYKDVKIMSFASDGEDGPTDSAGAFIDHQSFEIEKANEALEKFNSYQYFDEKKNLIKTGPTGANVMDIRVLWRD